MLATVARNKRPLEEEGHSFSCCPKYSPVRVKKQRFNPSPPGSPCSVTEYHSRDPFPCSPRKSFPSPDRVLFTQEEVKEIVERAVHNKEYELRQVLFTKEDVKKEVDRAVCTKEQELRTLFNKELEEHFKRVQEQFDVLIDAQNKRSSHLMESYIG